MPTMDSATSLATAEQALRDLLTAVMYKEHGPDWMDKVVEPSRRQEWKKTRAKKQNRG